MKGTKIELEERRHCHHHQQQQIAKRNCELDEYSTYTTSKYCNSYSFRFEKPYRRNVDKPNLSVTKIEFPRGVPALNTGTSLARWAQKRAKFKHKSKPAVPEVFEDSEEPLLEINNNDKSPSELQDVNDETEEEIDYDVAQLILAAADFHEVEEAMEKERPQKKRKSKGVRFALSKPQSPQSIQVIRVDVTSSYEEDESSCEDYRERFQNLVDEHEDDDNGKDNKEFEIVCQKLALLPRE
ncbi:PREDICTED: uncharacterized protein LOC108568095 [Nicrophorus vespilloides]|uniref:Uncharacterized protein LOC108568095 n=1 Tax=Nicrophorus vespilloides TaxID=110193 RepID=A0ABM1NCF5_NICVS|nr:PREDICTED: uncharacterized protein LOC108568095 [Nicrophorus vespilloides]XP_017784504.1 PREDICTED: uncharacterized protein LOC108568095 [Nicrophorus vespilloides]XP_017784505.1 PREDICTED: uncharacterized protein LOC108568095 [Nicrophorus vespilloides]